MLRPDPKGSRAFTKSIGDEVEKSRHDIFNKSTVQKHPHCWPRQCWVNLSLYLRPSEIDRLSGQKNYTCLFFHWFYRAGIIREQQYLQIPVQEVPLHWYGTFDRNMSETFEHGLTSLLSNSFKMVFCLEPPASIFIGTTVKWACILLGQKLIGMLIRTFEGSF